jgi:branched-chain amino acid transport system substrate-binding protein
LLALQTSPTLAQKAYGPGVTDSEIRIGQTMPYSGPASARSTVGKAQAAFFKMINDNGGINGRKVTLIPYDDAYSPPKAVGQVRRLVEGDEVLLIFQMLGSPSNAAVQKYLNQRKVPQLLSVTGTTRFSNYKEFPWTMAINPNYQSEGYIYAKFILANYPNARIGVL